MSTLVACWADFNCHMSEAWSKRARSSTGISEHHVLETDTVVLWSGDLPRMLNIVDGMPVATKQRLRMKESAEHEDLEALAASFQALTWTQAFVQGDTSVVEVRGHFKAGGEHSVKRELCPNGRPIEHRFTSKTVFSGPERGMPNPLPHPHIPGTNVDTGGCPGCYVSV